MEENNNNPNKANEVVKKEAKKVGTNLLKKIVPTILPVIGVFFLILFAIGIINLIPWLINNLVNKILSIFNISESASSLAGESQSIVEIAEDGTYNLKIEDLSEQILEQIEEQGVDIETLGFVTEDLENMIDKYIQAEIKTTYLKTGKSDIDGIITVKRAIATGEDAGKKDKELEYVSAKEFDQMLDGGDEEVFNCFSIDPDTFELWIARAKDITVYYDMNGNQYKTEGGGTAKEVLDYQTLVKNYSAPLNFWITLHVISQNEDFMNDLLELAVGEEKEDAIVLTYVDSLQTQTIEYDYTGYVSTTTDIIHPGEPEYENYVQENAVALEEGKLDDISEGTQRENINSQNVKQYLDDVSEYSKKVQTSYSGELYVTNVDTWIKNCDKTINAMETRNMQPYEESNPKKNETEEPKYIGIRDSETSETALIKTTITTMISEVVTSSAASKAYTIVDGEGEIKVDDLIDLIRAYPSVENNISSAPSNVLYLLQQSESTQTLEKLMRYVLYKLNDVDYGVLERDLKYLFGDEDSIISVSNILRDYIRYWERASLPLTNEKGDCYVIEAGDEGQAIVGYGVDVETYKQLFIDAEYPTEIGEVVPIEFVDAIEEEYLDTLVEDVKSYVSGLDLKSYQINALVSRAHDQDAFLALGLERGTDGLDFASACSKYWNQETDSQYEERNSNPDKSHQLYVQYLSKSITSDNGHSTIQALRKNESEWILFQCGFYRELNQWHTSGLDIIEKADEIHKYMEAYKYTYCVNGNNGGEECEEFGKVGHGWNKTFQRSKTGYHTTCCATYVSWVLIETGLMTEEEFTPSAGGVSTVLLEQDWIKITDPEELEPGDILFYSNEGIVIKHVDIYAGDATKYNAGSGYSIRGASPEKMNMANFNKDFFFALRVP